MASTDQVRRLYDRLGERYDRWTTLPDRVFFNGLRRTLLGGARGRVLEVAVGSGKNLEYYPAECEIVGLDLSESMLEVATRRARAARRKFEAVRGDAKALPYADGEFDTVVCTLAGCTFVEPVAVFREMRRVCRPGGSVLFLEHVRPTNPWLARLALSIQPVARAAVGCHLGRDTIDLIAQAGLDARVEATAFGDFLVALRART
jgi:ubiquinone/menaquinone biosynthesis C-methylase UbiE